MLKPNCLVKTTINNLLQRLSDHPYFHWQSIMIYALQKSISFSQAKSVNIFPFLHRNVNSLFPPHFLQCDLYCILWIHIPWQEDFLCFFHLFSLRWLLPGSVADGTNLRWIDTIADLLTSEGNSISPPFLMAYLLLRKTLSPYSIFSLFLFLFVSVSL